MKKTFNYNVPDELWVDNFSKGLIASATYDGPETINVMVSKDRYVAWGNNIPEVYDSEKNKVVILNANELPNVAYYITNQSNVAEHVFEDEIMHDGSVYKKISNPSIFDYYQLVYFDGLSDPWRFELITKEKNTAAELKVADDLDYVKRYNNAYDFDIDTTTAINGYITKAEKYLSDMKTIYPWKYIEITTPVPPKMPVALINAFKDLPKV